MNYPRWLEQTEQFSSVKINHLYLIELAKDAWQMAHNAGCEGAMTHEEFCNKYGDSHPNDGARV